MARQHKRLAFDFKAADKLRAAFQKHGYTSSDVRMLRTGDQLGTVLGVIRGTHQIVPIAPIEHTIDLGTAPGLPFEVARVWDDRGLRVVQRGSGMVKLERKSDDLYLDGREIKLFRSNKQIQGTRVRGFELQAAIEARGNNLPVVVLDYLIAHPELWPQSWKRVVNGELISIFSWDTIFCGPRGADLCVRAGYWKDGQVFPGTSFSMKSGAEEIWLRT
jgi:hypothetical protein